MILVGLWPTFFGILPVYLHGIKTHDFGGILTHICYGIITRLFAWDLTHDFGGIMTHISFGIITRLFAWDYGPWLLVELGSTFVWIWD